MAPSGFLLSVRSSLLSTLIPPPPSFPPFPGTGAQAVSLTPSPTEISVEKEDFSVVERRQKAIAFLDNPELLMMYAQATGDVSFFLSVPFLESPLPTAIKSIPGARLHFTEILCGYDDEEPEHTSRHSAHSHSRRDHQNPADKRREGVDHGTGSNQVLH